MQLNSTIEKFYLDILNYAGVEIEDNIFVNSNKKLGEISIEGKGLALPYFEILKHPEGKLIFHILNENYTSPESAAFNFYKKRLVLELNLKLSSLIVSLITISSDPQLQRKIKSSKLLDIVTNIGETDPSQIEALLNLVKASKKVNEEAFLFDIFLKKNGEINDVPYSAIGKINFLAYSELQKSIENKDSEFRVFGHKLRKKDLLTLSTIFQVIFPGINDKIAYSEGTDNKIFRYLSALLKTSYLISSRMNEVANLLLDLNETSLNITEIVSNLDWTSNMEKLCDMGNEIRLIPNQTDVSMSSNRLKVDESKSTQQQPPVYQTPQQPVQQQPMQQQMQQPMMQQPVQPPRQLTPEEIIRSNMHNPAMSPMMMQPMMMQPMMMQAPQPMLPTWAQQEIMAKNQAQNMQQPMMQPMMQPMLQQPMQQNVYMDPNLMAQQQMMNQMHMNNQMHPHNQHQAMHNQSSLQVNPMFVGRATGPWG